MPRDFSKRSTERELMDGDSIGLDEFRGCLEDLASVNTLTLTRAPALAFLNRVTRDLRPSERLSVLDVGYGHGDLLRAIRDWSRKQNIEADLIGVDLNPWSAVVARSATAPDAAIDYRTGDVFAFDAGQPIDLVVSSQFTHHLPDEAVVEFIRWMERVAARGWFIGDLHRHPVPFHAFGLLSELAGWHAFIRHDGPVSIARSFRREDWERLLRAAGLDPIVAEIRWHVPFRLCVSRLR